MPDSFDAVRRAALALARFDLGTGDPTEVRPAAALLRANATPENVRRLGTYIFALAGEVQGDAETMESPTDPAFFAYIEGVEADLQATAAETKPPVYRSREWRVEAEAADETCPCGGPWSSCAGFACLDG